MSSDCVTVIVADVSVSPTTHSQPDRALDLLSIAAWRVVRFDLLDDLRQGDAVAGLVDPDWACRVANIGKRSTAAAVIAIDAVSAMAALDTARRRDMEPSSAMSEMRWLSVRRPMNGVTPITCGCGSEKASSASA